MKEQMTSLETRPIEVVVRLPRRAVTGMRGACPHFIVRREPAGSRIATHVGAGYAGCFVPQPWRFQCEFGRA